MAKKAKNRGPFGELLRTQRKSQKVTMLKLSKAVGVSESYISLLESGARQQPARELVLKLAHALGARSTNQLADQFLLAAGYYPADKQMYENHGDTLQAYYAEIEKDPQNYPAYNALIFAHIKLRQPEQAEALIARARSVFKDNAQLNALSASLELSRQHFDEAIALQQKALDSEGASAHQRRFELNLAVMYFLRGLSAQNAWFSHQQNDDREQAKADYHKASDILEALLKTEHDVYILDEYARISFNLAFIGGETEATLQSYWQRASESFRKVLAASDKFVLGRELLQEACIFLAHAYTHQQKYELAEMLIHTLEVATNPSTAIIYYLKSCFHSLKGSHENTSSHVEAGLEALSTSHRLSRDFTQQAHTDPDLAWLRQKAPDEFRKILTP